MTDREILDQLVEKVDELAEQIDQLLDIVRVQAVGEALFLDGEAVDRGFGC